MLTWKSRLKQIPSTAIVVAGALLIGTLAVIPFFFSRRERVPGSSTVLRLIDSHDLWMHLFIMPQFDKVLRSGVIYPRWIPDINMGYGLLNMIYYPPGLFYLSSAVHVVIDDWIYTTFVVSALALAGSGISLYILARTFYSKVASAIASAVYMLIPFHLLDLYWRGALPQFVGYCFLPLVVYFAYRVGREAKPLHYAGLGLTFGLYLLTHLPVSLMLTYTLGFYALIWSWRERDVRIALRIAGGALLGLMLGAVYWLPAAFETKYTYENASILFPYHESYITLLPLRDDANAVAFFRLVNDVFIAHAVVLIVPILLLLFAARRSGKEIANASNASTGDPKELSRNWSPTGMWIVMGALTLFMCTSFSIYLSKLLPKIQVAVPAWRWLALASVFTALVIGACVDLLGKNSRLPSRKLWGYRLLLGGALAFALWVSIHGTILGALKNPTYHPKVDVISNLIEPNFTPKSASRPQDLPDTPLVVTPMGGSSEVVTWDPQYRQIAVKLEAPGVVRLKTYNFPGWIARIDGKKEPMLSDEDGIQLVEVPAGRHVVEADFTDTAPRLAGKISFGLGFVMVIGLAAIDLKGRAKSLSAGEMKTKLATLISRRKTSIAGVAVVMLFVLGFVLVRWSTSGVRTDPARNEPRLSLPGSDAIPVAVGEKDLDELLSAIASRNNDRVEEMIRSGKVFRVRPDSRIRVLKTGYGKINIRIVEGESIALEGWVPERWIR